MFFAVVVVAASKSDGVSRNAPLNTVISLGVSIHMQAVNKRKQQKQKQRTHTHIHTCVFSKIIRISAVQEESI